MTHHISSFMHSVMLARKFADEQNIQNVSLTFTFDTPREYAKVISEVTRYFDSYLLFAAYTDDPSKAWYENFMLYGVDVTLTYKGKQ